MNVENHQNNSRPRPQAVPEVLQLLHLLLIPLQEGHGLAGQVRQPTQAGVAFFGA